MSKAFDTALTFVLKYEGGFSDDPDDPGNWTGGDVGKGELKGTNLGVSAASYPDLDIANLTREQVEPLYKADFWDKCRCEELPTELAIVLLDSAVNQGPSGAVKCLQKSLNVTADGVIGSATINAANTCIVLDALPEFIAQRNARYAQNENIAKYALGWYRRTAACHQLVLNL